MRILLIETTQYDPASPLFLEALVELQEGKEIEFDFLDEAKFLKSLSTSLVHKVAFRILKQTPSYLLATE